VHRSINAMSNSTQTLLQLDSAVQQHLKRPRARCLWSFDGGRRDLVNKLTLATTSSRTYLPVIGSQY
jgi:hypothetical protein